MAIKREKGDRGNAREVYEVDSKIRLENTKIYSEEGDGEKDNERKSGEKDIEL